jgi:hypothetical protein
LSGQILLDPNKVMKMDQHQVQVDTIVNGAHQRAASLSSAIADEEEQYRSSAVELAHQLEQIFSSSREQEIENGGDDANQPGDLSDGRTWVDDDEVDFSDGSWLE